MVETLYQVSPVSLTPGFVGSTSTTVSPTSVPPTSAVQPALTTSVQSDAITDGPDSTTTTVGPESTTTTDGPESTTTTDGPESTTTTVGPESITTTDGPESTTTTDDLKSTTSTCGQEFTTTSGPESATITGTTGGTEPIAITSGMESTRSPGGAVSTTTTLPHVLVSFHRSTNTGSWMREYLEARGRDVDGIVLWRKSASTCLHGVRLCSADPACVAIRCNLVGGTSKGFSSVSKIGDTHRSAETGALFVFE
ncbi:hypothetical protein MAR_000190 [Mya arenaria]|uniref:Uncharacterized protein n=1 Tax=Mya arenaria TaxID=6604 RepID=A0ABY7F817_MYAAR|nr:hypothetical protein MAR_000190 [Mya arenaria]